MAATTGVPEGYPKQKDVQRYLRRYHQRYLRRYHQRYLRRYHQRYLRGTTARGDTCGAAAVPLPEGTVLPPHQRYYRRTREKQLTPETD